MFNRKYTLVSPRHIVEVVDEILLNDQDIIVKPTYLSICAADIRYYSGQRDEKALREKLPLTLIHEAIGEVMYDPSGEYKKGQKVVMVPNTPTQHGKYKENYDRTSLFASSSSDGFMQDVLKIEKTRVIDVSGIDPYASVMLELMSVVFNAIDDLPKEMFKDDNVIGIWGNGNIGYLATIILRKLYPNVKIYVFGRDEKKNQYFTMAHRRFTIDNLPKDLYVDHAIECVGGNGSEVAIKQIIDVIKPQGVLSLLGVSERAPQINTRMVLEKGLTLVGSSRSGYVDFENAVALLKSSTDIQKQIRRLITEVVEVESIEDMNYAFEKSMNTEFKTIMKWSV